MSDQELVLTLVYETLKAIDKKINDAPSLILIEGRVLSALGNDSYLVRIQGKDYKAKSHFQHSVGSKISLIGTKDYSNLFAIY